MADQTELLKNGSRKRILVIDDNRDAANTLAMLIKLKGNEVKAGYGGREAMVLGETFQPDIAILDIGMPGMDGYETCSLIRQESWGKNITILALTGYGQQEDIRKSLEAGFDEHLLKPVDLPALLALIEKTSKNNRISD